MKTPELTIKIDNIAYWFNALRNLDNDGRTKALEAFWSGQLSSKAWLVDELNKVVTTQSNIYIFGGWIGVLANLLLQGATFPIGKVRSIDVDPWCESVADTVNKPYEMDDWKFKAVTADMASYVYQNDLPPSIVINTSTEHVTQDTYCAWFNRIPSGTLVVAQGNNYYNCEGHIRCTSSLQQFAEINMVKNPVFTGCHKTEVYTRYMCIWQKI